uniref:Homing endonuclease LAGLIDADG domain-containing protein n=1 Tax=Arthrobotrys musiformis TaxID=47236 RepID=A0A482EAM9_9PEZI|nr:hypothetical protein [Arthrobotrys musiformis]
MNCHNNWSHLVKTLALSQLHKDLIIGCGLGDATFNMNPNGNASIGFDQGLPNKEYLLYLFNIMKEYATQPQIGERISFDKRYDKKNFSYNFRTKASITFFPFANLFLKKQKDSTKYVKIVPPCIKELLTPGALAFWLQNDGQHVKNGGVTLCTDNYTYDDVQLLKSVLENKYKLKCTIHNKNPNKGYFRIYISGKSLHVLQPLVVDYFHQSMLYKIHF